MVVSTSSVRKIISQKERVMSTILVSQGMVNRGISIFSQKSTTSWGTLEIWGPRFTTKALAPA